MDNRTDQELLRAYAQMGEEGAFAELVRRYVDLVYSAALRVVSDPHLAEDASQRVFAALAGSAASVARLMVVAGWLHRTTHHISANIVRAEVRRRAREQHAVAMKNLFTRSSDPAWDQLAGEVDDALCELNQPDRDALLLRYFHEQSAREMAATLGISSEAAQKRVNRALERLREAFGRRGIAVGSGALASLLAANAVQSAPAGLSAVLSAGALAHGTFQTSIASTLTKIIAMTTIQKVVVAAVIVAGLAIAGYEVGRPRQMQASAQTPEAAQQNPNPNSSAMGEDQAPAQSRARSARRPMAPPVRVAQSEATAARPFPSTQLYQFLKSKAPVLSVAQIEPFLKFNDRTPRALLAAFRTTTDASLLAEAMQRYPNAPEVAFEAAVRNGLSAEERRQWLDAFKQADSDNSLTSFLSAAAYLKAGRAAEAFQDLTTAAALTPFRDYAEERIQDDEQAYLAAGYSAGEAKVLANNFVATPYLVQLRELGQDLVTMAAAYQNSGDATSRETALDLAVSLGRRLSEPSGGERLNAQLVGINIERTALSALPAADTYPGGGLTVQQRLDDLIQQKEAIHTLTGQADPLWATLSEQDWLDYHAQLAASGEARALRWLVSSHRQR